jgi:tetratricopeptide (TPR) repeat protein
MDLILNKRIDSLCTIYLVNNSDTTQNNFFLKAKGFALMNIGDIYFYQGEYTLALEYYSKSLEISAGIINKSLMANCLMSIGNIYSNQAEYAQALKYYAKSLKISEENKDKTGVIGALKNLGNVFYYQGDYSKAIEYFTKALKVSEETGNKGHEAGALNNIGVIYLGQGDFEKALEYYFEAVKIQEEIGGEFELANCLDNIGGVYSRQHKYLKAMEYHNKGLKIREKIGDNRGIATSLGNIGVIYSDQGDYARAIDYYTQSLKIGEEIGENMQVSITLNNIASVYNKKGEYAKSIEFSERSSLMAKEIGAPLLTQNAAELLWEVNKKIGRYKESLKMYELFIATRDSIESEANQKAVIQQEYKYAYEKQAAADSITNAEAGKVKDALLTVEKAENKQHQLEATAQKQQAYFLYGGLGLALLFGGFIFNRFRVTSKQKGIIEQQKGKVETTLQAVEHQKEIIEEAHKEITDSIDYAERIQRSFLATKEVLDTNLKDYFVFFKPKDVVSGDFYWADLLSNGTFAVVNADSTGHGVPGAIMSILNISSIEGAIKEGATTPHEIFNKTRKSIIKRLQKDGSPEGGKDGMDASIVCFDFENKKLTYTAAQNPIWIIRDGNLTEVKPEKMPIGKHEFDHVPFEGGEFDIQKGDQIYTLTDGFQDQFGGPKGKKFMVKKMREYVLSISHLPMAEQHQKLNEVFSDWQGDVEQVDDVCVIGVRI